MKKPFFLTLATLTTLCLSSANGQETIYGSDIGSEGIEDTGGLEKGSPFSFSAFFDATGKAKINKGFFKGDHFQFAIGNAELSSVLYYCQTYKEAIQGSLGYTQTYYGWDENPWFSQTNFSTLSLTLKGITERFDRWTWRAQAQANYDGWKTFDAQYFNYDFMLWGRYHLFNDLGIHMGFYLETGMRMDRIYPILGFDWKINDRLKLNAVFPMDMTLEYQFAKEWIVSLAGRTFSSRHRVREDDCHPRYLARYTDFGIEAMLRYTYAKIDANIHVGFTTGGDFRISNEDNNHPVHYHLDPTGYLGAEVDCRF